MKLDDKQSYNRCLNNFSFASNLCIFVTLLERGLLCFTKTSKILQPYVTVIKGKNLDALSTKFTNVQRFGEVIDHHICLTKLALHDNLLSRIGKIEFFLFLVIKLMYM